MQIRNANLADCKTVAELHKKYLDQSFFASLGCNFLTLIYQAISKFDQGILIIAENDKKEIVGFISGCLNIKNLYKNFLKKNFFKAGFLLLPKIINLKNFKKILETLKYSQTEIGIKLPSAELLSIAVNEECRGTGVSRQLFERLRLEFDKQGIKEFKLIVGHDLIAAQKFYEKMGCETVAQSQMHKGAFSNILIFNKF